jgi:hypothetical protein
MINLSLEEILQRKKEHKEQVQQSIDWNKEKDLWIKSVETLYQEIELWLKKYKEKELLDFSYSYIDLEESDIGKYKIRQMHIKLPDEDIKLTPLGTMLIGAFGRIDIESRLKTIPLILMGKEDETSKDEMQEDKWKSLSWKILLKDPNKPLYITLDEILFTDIFKEIISNG